MTRRWRPSDTAPRFLPLLGALIGVVGGAVYWLGAQLWPTSIAVILSMLATALLSARIHAGTAPPAPTPTPAAARDRDGGLGLGPVAGLPGVFIILVKYNALMALSAANLPFAVPANLALGLIMVAGQASSRALVVSAAKPASYGDLGIALAIGFTPAALIGLPGLIGLAAALIARIGYMAYIRRYRPGATAAELNMTQQLTEVCFYLGALAAWAYI
jgi:adenosylcobinamide-GDP ribazoletransferase